MSKSDSTFTLIDQLPALLIDIICKVQTYDIFFVDFHYRKEIKRSLFTIDGNGEITIYSDSADL